MCPLTGSDRVRERTERPVRDGRVPLGEHAHAARRLEPALGGRARDRRAAAHARLPGSLLRPALCAFTFTKHC